MLQGETLSSSLFLIFINDFIDVLINFDLKGSLIAARQKVQTLGYADDFVLFASNYAEMLRKIRVLDWYCDQNALELNFEESKIMIFHKGKLNYAKYKFPYKNKYLEIV